MAKAQEYLDAYETQLAEFNKLVEDYNKSIEDYDASFYNKGASVEGTGMNIGRPLKDGFVAFMIPDFGLVGRKPKETGAAELIRTQGSGRVKENLYRDPVTGKQFSIKFDSKRSTEGYGVMVDENTIGYVDGRLLRFNAVPGDFTSDAPSFDMEKYQGLLQSDFEEELAGQKAQFELARKAEEEKYVAQKAELEKEQAALEAENAKALEAAEKLRVESETAAAAANEERERRTKQLRDETETLQRNTGAQRAGFVRARRLRNRPLLGL